MWRRQGEGYAVFLFLIVEHLVQEQLLCPWERDGGLMR
jgi:hypothetical protein